MSTPRYRVSRAEADRIVALLDLVKVDHLSLDRGPEEDHQVKLKIHHSMDYLRQPCVDQYHLTLQEGAVFVGKKFCKAYRDAPASGIAVRPDQTEKWFALKMLFVFDKGGIRSVPENWQKAKSVVLKNVHDKMWSFANPSLDFARWFWGVDGEKERGNWEDFESWKAFAAFLLPMEASLQKIADNQLSMASLQTAGPLFAGLFSDAQQKPPLEKMNALYATASAYSKEALEQLRREVSSVIFSEYPFLPPKDLEDASFAVSAWLAKRLLFHAAALSKRQKMAERIPSLVPLTTPLSELDIPYQRRLAAAMLDENAASRDMDVLKKGYAHETWARQREVGGEALATFEEIETHRKIMHARFDRSVGLVALKNLWRQKVALDGGKRDLLSRRLHALLEIPMEQEMTDRIFSDVKKRPAWERFNFYAAPTRDNLLGLDAAPENLAEEAAQIAVQEQIVKQDGVSYAKPYSLSAPAALKISVEFEKMSQEGVDSGKLSPAFARGLLLSLLRLGEGDFLDLSKEARHVLSAALRDYPDLTAAAAEEEPLPALVAIDPPAKREVKKQEEDPLYEKWWFWAVIGGVLAGAGGGFAVWRHNQKDPREPATGGGGSGNNGNGSSDDDDDGDGRGASTTVGP